MFYYTQDQNLYIKLITKQRSLHHLFGCSFYEIFSQLEYHWSSCYFISIALISAHFGSGYGYDKST